MRATRSMSCAHVVAIPCSSRCCCARWLSWWPGPRRPRETPTPPGGLSAEVVRLYEEASLATQQYEAGRREAEVQRGRAQRLERLLARERAGHRRAARGPRPDRPRPVPQRRRAPAHRADAARGQPRGTDARSACRLAGGSGRQQRRHQEPQGRGTARRRRGEGGVGLADAGAAQRRTRRDRSGGSRRSWKRPSGRSRGRRTPRSPPARAGVPSGSTSRERASPSHGSRRWRRTNSPRASAAAVIAGRAGTPGRTSRWTSARRCGRWARDGW